MLNKAYVIVFLALITTGCVTPIALDNVEYTGATYVSSSKTAKVELITGAVRGSSSSGLLSVGNNIYVNVSIGSSPELQFGDQDQEAFAESLRKELVRLGLVASIVDASSASQSDLKITLFFFQTHHQPDLQVYTLDLAMEIVGDNEPFIKKYRAISNEKDTLWQKINTNAYQGKEKGVKRLMEKIIPDIESYIARQK